MDKIFNYFADYYKWLLDPQVQVRTVSVRFGKWGQCQRDTEATVSESSRFAICLTVSSQIRIMKIRRQNRMTTVPPTATRPAAATTPSAHVPAPAGVPFGAVPQTQNQVWNPLGGLPGQINPVAIAQQKGMSEAQIRAMGGLGGVAAWHAGQGAMPPTGGAGQYYAPRSQGKGPLGAPPPNLPPTRLSK